MHVQNLLALSAAALAGSALAAQFNGGEVPAAIRGKHRASSSASVAMMATPSSVAGLSSHRHAELPSSAMMMMVTVTVTPTVTVFGTPSDRPTFSPSSSVALQKSFTPKISPSSSHRPHSSSASHTPRASSSGLSTKIGVPISDLVDSKDADKSRRPFWNEPKTTKTTYSPANHIIKTGNVPITTKDDCSLRCQDLAEQCVDLLPKENDFCWTQYPECQDLCVSQHVDS